MRVSEEQKSQIRQKLLESAVKLFTQKGFANTTMREISVDAGYGAGTIYNYFSTKEKIYYGYFEQKQKQMEAEVKGIEDFETFTIKEKLQTLLEVQLDIYTADREFVDMTFKALLDSPMRSFTELQPAKNDFVSLVSSCIDTAIAAQELPPQPFQPFLANLFWDYKNLMIIYWLKDETSGFTNTSTLIDMSIEVYVDLLRSDFISKGVGIFTFLVKSHLYGNMDKLLGIASLAGQFAAVAQKHANPSVSDKSIKP